eukprot:jgi/Picsp_1/3813/NSC_01325-R1_aminotransferase class v
MASGVVVKANALSCTHDDPWTPLQIKNALKDTPGVSHVVHFNSAGSSLPTEQTLNAVTEYLKEEAIYGGYETAKLRESDLFRPYKELSRLLNCDPSEIAIVTSATEAWLQAIYGLAWTWMPGDRILTSLNEYGTNYITYLQLKKRFKIEVEVIPETAEGDICLSSLEQEINDGSKRPAVLISLTHIPTSSGRVYDAEGVGKLANKYEIVYLLDACQSIGQLRVDVHEIGCDMLSGTGRKFLRAPRGSGFLYCSSKIMETFEPASLDVSSAEWESGERYKMKPTAIRFEKYEMSFAAKVGLGIAVRYCNDVGLESIERRILWLAFKLRSKLASIEQVRVCDVGARLCGIVSFAVTGVSADNVHTTLQTVHGISTSVSRITSSRLDFENRGLVDIVRASVHYYNTETEIDSLVAALKNIVQ